MVSWKEELQYLTWSDPWTVGLQLFTHQQELRELFTNLDQDRAGMSPYIMHSFTACGFGLPFYTEDSCW